MVMVHETIKYIKKRRQPSLQDTEATKKLNYGERMIPPAELIIRKPEEDVSVAALWEGPRIFRSSIQSLLSFAILRDWVLWSIMSLLS